MKSRIILSTLISGTLLASCGEKESHNETTHEAVTTADSTVSDEVTTSIGTDDELEFKMDLMISNSITGPSQLITDMNNNGSFDFIQEAIIPMENGKSFEGTSVTKALFFGALGADMTYLGIHDRPDLALKHVAGINKLSEDLDCGMEMDDEKLEKFDTAKEDGQLMADMMFDEYVQVDEYLRNNERTETAAHILTGALIESLYIVLEQMKGKELDDQSTQLLYGQKQSINELADIYASISETEGNTAILEHLNNLKEKFNAEEGITAESIDAIREMTTNFRGEIVDEEIL